MKGKIRSTYSLYITFLLAHCIVTAAQLPPIIQPASIEIKVIDNNGVCTLNNTLHSQVANKVDEILHSSILPQLYRYDLYGPGLSRNFPASSCTDIHQGLPSGYYLLNVTNESQPVYCSLNENRCITIWWSHSCCGTFTGSKRWSCILHG